MKFGVRNAPAMYVTMMNDLNQLWKELYEKYKLEFDNSNSSSIIVDDVLSFGTTMDQLFILLECIYMISTKYHLT